MKPDHGDPHSHTSRDTLTVAWRKGEITTKEFHSQWVAMAVRSAIKQRQSSKRPQP